MEDEELQDAARGLFQSGKLFHRGAVRDALAEGCLPVAYADEYPRATFGSTTSGPLLINVQRSGSDAGRWRDVTDADREQWASTFRRFIDACLARNTETEHPNDEDDTR